MNKDEIKKALRCCSKGQGCCDCPHWCEAGCRYQTLSDALELITEQEQEIERQNSRIKALNNRLNEKYELISDMETAYENDFELLKSQRREIDKLKADYANLQEQFAAYQIASDKEIRAQVKQAQIDVLNELKKRSYTDNDFKDGKWHRYILINDIDEMIEENENDRI